MLRKKEAYTRLIIVAAILLLVNIIASRLYRRIDLTQEKRYTLSDATRQILKKLDAPVSVTLFFSKDLPPGLEDWKQNITSEVKELAANTNVPVAYTVTDPGSDPENEIKAQRAGVTAQQISVSQNDQNTQKRVYIGAEIRYKDRSDVIPYLEPGSNIEYFFARSLRLLAEGKTVKVGVVTGQGEPRKEKIIEAWEAIEHQYNIDSVRLNSEVNLSAYKTLIIVEPTDSFTTADLSKLADYAINGGNLFIASSMAQVSMQQSLAIPKKTNLAAWLAKVGINIQSSLVTDAQCSEFTVPQQSGMMKYYMKVKFPFAPTVTSFGAHPATKGIQSVVMPFSSPVTLSPGNQFQSTMLAATSNLSDILPLPTDLPMTRQWKETDFTRKNIPLAWALTTSKSSRWIIIGNGVFMQSTQKGINLPAQNLNFCMNAIDWLNDDSGLIDLRNKGIANRPLTEITESDREVLKYMNLLLPITIIVLAGFLRALWQKRRQKRWKENSI